MKEYEIWVGNYSLGQGYGATSEPEMIGKETSIDFPTACLKHELKTKLKSIEEQEFKGYVQEQSKEWFYNWRTNICSWLGKYYQTREEALMSFK